MKTRALLVLLSAFLFAKTSEVFKTSEVYSQTKEVIPHAQSKPPGPALSPQEALKKMTVPPGFTVELVASEPDIVNPVAMTIDERGRFWITESLEYPKRAAGPGKDRVKVLEDTDNDGKADKFTTVLEGLNIPSGIAVGHGGVWVANSPDILYYPLLDRDTLKLGKPEVVCTGFGRDDTHELPNSLTWGPDGWLYGLNGVFNRSRVKSNNGKTYEFTCALFRIHPRTKEFQIFCEGTSNPWGLAFNENGDAFVSACVIDHLWHLVETGYYHRQGGPYPPFTWKIESIVKHKHQKAAYCGLTFFDSDAYPPEYREKMYMGNIHGNCINCDTLTRDGSTYFAKPALHPSPLRGEGPGVRGKEALGIGVGEGSNFLMANDAWFMPVVQTTGPDGCLYILDWYDRYHCYQDANRDPAGIDRLRGRLYRVRYKETPRAGKFDLGKESDDQLIGRLSSRNVYHRDHAQRLLSERLVDQLNKYVLDSSQQSYSEIQTIWGKLHRTVFDENQGKTTRLHALGAIIGAGATTLSLVEELVLSKDSAFRAWGVRAFVNRRAVAGSKEEATRARVFNPRGFQKKDVVRLTDSLAAMAKDASSDVQLQVAIAARKIPGVNPIAVLLDVVASCGDDKLIPHIVWQNLHPTLDLESSRTELVRVIGDVDLNKAANVVDMMPRVVDRLLAAPDLTPNVVANLIQSLGTLQGNAIARGKVFDTISNKVQTGELAGARLQSLRQELLPVLAEPIKRSDFEATCLAATLNQPEAIAIARGAFRDGLGEGANAHRLKALAALVAVRSREILKDVTHVLSKPKESSSAFRGQVLQTLGKLDDAEVAGVVLKHYPTMEPDLQPKAVDVLTQRPGWSKALLHEIAQKKLPPSVLNVNQVRKLLATKDADLVKQVTKVWGTVRDGRNPQREQLVAEMRDVIKKTPGDPRAGALHFKKICAQCHKMHGDGQEVGPDITSNGRGDFEQLLSNVFDPSLVIGAGYTATTVVNNNGQVLSGLLVEDSPQRIVLKTQGGKIETIARGDVDQVARSKLSYMPEDVEKQLRPQEIADLFAYLCLDRPPEDPKARKIPGTPR